VTPRPWALRGTTSRLLMCHVDVEHRCVRVTLEGASSGRSGGRGGTCRRPAREVVDWAGAGQCYLRAAEQASWGDDAVAAMAHVRRGLACPVPEALRVRLLGTLCEAGVWYAGPLSGALPEAEELVRCPGPGPAGRRAARPRR
jgi:hypothetical protein